MKDIDSKYSHYILVCHGSKCTKNGAEDIRQDLRKALKDQNIKAKVTKTSCQGLCKQGCIVFVQHPDKAHAWQDVSPKDIPNILTKL